MKYRLIEQVPYSAAMNMAIDHSIYESVANERELPTIRFYKWTNSSISLGAYQNPKEVNLDLCREKNIDVVRRMTGGRAVFHDKVDFTYSVVAPIRIFNYSLQAAYKEICSCIINALKDMGIKADLENKNDIMVKGKKISGNASKAMDKGIYLQHGTLIYDLDLDVMPKVLNIDSDAVKEKVTSVLQHKKLSQKKVYDTLRENFIKDKEIQVDKLSKFELIRAEDLSKSAYSSVFLPAGSFMKNKGACYVERGG